MAKKKDKNGKSYYKLIPIDHSLSLPDCIKISEYEMCWMGWDQINKPISIELKNYIKKIDILDDMKRMSQCIKLRDVCFNFFNLSRRNVGKILE